MAKIQGIGLPVFGDNLYAKRAQDDTSELYVDSKLHKLSLRPEIRADYFVKSRLNAVKQFVESGKRTA